VVISVSICRQNRHLLFMLDRRSLGGLLGAALAAGVWPVRADARPLSPAPLFTIARSKNANVVRYVARRNENGLARRHPIDAYWLMLAEDRRREELSWAERELAYGFEVSAASRDGCLLHLTAFKQRALVVARHGQTFRAMVSIAGKRATLERIFVQTSEGGLLPSVQYIDVFGTAADGTPLKERLTAT